MDDQSKILIVDDSPETIDELSGALSDFKQMIALNGEKALQLAESELPPDLILLDIMMPGMDGYEVCKKLKSNESTKDIPVIFLTAHTDVSEIVKGFRLGGQDYITKPFNREVLLARVKTHLELKASKELLKLINKRLDEKVEEKTAQLEKAYAELQDLDNKKAEFLNIISHEIRTPLNGIIGPLQLLKAKNKYNDLTNLINILDISVTRLERFSLTALTITNLRTRKHIVNRQPVIMEELIDNTLMELNEKFQQKNLQIGKNYISGNHIIYGEFDLLKMCINNILLNAIKYSEINGEISIQTIKSDSKIYCKISDKGPGFSKGALQKLFKFFTPGEPHIDKNIGLDLALVKMIIDAHDGEIEIENNKDGGATVMLIFHACSTTPQHANNKE